MKDNQKVISSLIQSISGQNHVLTIPKLFIDMTGSLDTALFLSQLLYWSGRCKRGDGGVFKTYDEWFSEISLSKYQVRKATGALKKQGVLRTEVRKARGNPTVHYYLDVEAVTDWIVKHLSCGRVVDDVGATQTERLSKQSLYIKKMLNTVDTDDIDKPVLNYLAGWT